MRTQGCFGPGSMLSVVAFTAFTAVAAVDASELASARPEAVGLSSERLARLDAAMQAEIDAGHKSGIVVLIARRGQLAHSKAYGFAERESSTRMTPEHLFRLYSMTKPITSVAL